jgi:hypothetical protein
MGYLTWLRGMGVWKMISITDDLKSVTRHILPFKSFSMIA